MSELTFDKDGSVILEVDGKKVKFVKESDLLAVKGGAESKVKEWDNEKTQLLTQLAESNRLRDETHTNLLKAQAAQEQLTKQYSDYDTNKVKVGELDKQLGSSRESLTKYEKELVERIRHNLINVHKAKEDALKDKTLDQLRNLEDAAKIFGGNGKAALPARYDGGAGASGEALQSARSKIHAGWDALHPDGK